MLVEFCKFLMCDSHVCIYTAFTQQIIYFLGLQGISIIKINLLRFFFFSHDYTVHAS